MNATNQKNRSGQVIGIIIGLLLAIGFSGVILLLIIHWAELKIYNYGDYLPWTLPMTTMIFLILGIVGIPILILEGRRIKRYFRGIRQNRVLKVFSLVFCIGIGFAGGVCYSLTVPLFYQYNFEAGPYLTWLNGQDPATEITILWRSNSPTPEQVQFGTHPGNLSTSIQGEQEGTVNRVELTGLNPDTFYYYRVVGFRNDQIKQFHTGPAGPATFSFAVFSDPRSNSPTVFARNDPSIQRQIATDFRTAGDELAFSLCTGDIAEGTHHDASWDLWFQDIAYQDFAANSSIAVTIGNHERMLDANGRLFRNYFPYDNLTYSFTYGNVHVICFDPWDPEYHWFGNITESQYQWLEQDLQSTSAPFIILGMHPAPITYGSLEGDWFNGHAFPRLSRLAEQYGIDAVFFGHNHHYELSLINGTYYMNVGMGNGIPDDGESTASFTVEERPGMGYCRVDVNATAMTLRPQWIDDFVSPAYTISI